MDTFLKYAEYTIVGFLGFAVAAHIVGLIVIVASR